MSTSYNPLLRPISALDAINSISSAYIILPKEFWNEIVRKTDPQTLEAAAAYWLGTNLPTFPLNAESPDLHVTVKTLRKAHRISQTQLAEKAEMKQSHYSDFERLGPKGFDDRKSRIARALEELVQEKTANPS